MFGAYVRQGLPCRKSFPDCPTMRTHAREQQKAADLATMYILSQGIAPRPGWFSSLFEHFKAREACISSPPVLFPCLFSFPLKINSRSLKHITTPLSLKISPTIEFLSFRQANYVLNPNKRSCAILRALHAINGERLKAQHTESQMRICCTRPQYVV